MVEKECLSPQRVWQWPKPYSAQAAASQKWVLVSQGRCLILGKPIGFMGLLTPLVKIHTPILFAAHRSMWHVTPLHLMAPQENTGPFEGPRGRRGPSKVSLPVGHQ
jgi:hypothetical protein